MKPLIIFLVLAVILPFSAGYAFADDDDFFARSISCHGLQPCSAEWQLSHEGFPTILYSCLFVEDVCSRNVNPMCQARNFHRTCDDMLKAFHDEMNKPREQDQ